MNWKRTKNTRVSRPRKPVNGKKNDWNEQKSNDDVNDMNDQSQIDSDVKTISMELQKLNSQNLSISRWIRIG